MNVGSDWNPALKHHLELLLTSGRTVSRRELTLLYPLAVIDWMGLPVYCTLLLHLFFFSLTASPSVSLMWRLSHFFHAQMLCCLYCLPNDYQLSAEVGAQTDFQQMSVSFFCTQALSPLNTLFSGYSSAFVEHFSSSIVLCKQIHAHTVPRPTSNWGRIEHLDSCLWEAALMNK